MVAQRTGVDPSEVPEISLSESLATTAGGPSADHAPVLPPSATGAEFARYYAVSERTIDTWRRSEAPLSEPTEMRAWWARTYPGRSINRKILAAIVKASADPASAPAPVAQPLASAVPEQTREIREDEIGFDQTHRRMLEAEARLSARIQALEDAGNLPEADLLRQDWIKLTTALGSADTKQIRNALQRGDLLPRGVVEREYATLLAHHQEVLRAEIKAMRLKLTPKPPAKGWEADTDAMIDELFRALPELLTASIQNTTQPPTP